MKNKAVEAMVRVQFNIPDDVKVFVTFLSSVGDDYNFEVVWYNNDILCQSNFTLPHISSRSSKMKIQDVLRQWSSSTLHKGHREAGELAAYHIDRLEDYIKDINNHTSTSLTKCTGTVPNLMVGKEVIY